jgi:hypothetical protein
MTGIISPASSLVAKLCWALSDFSMIFVQEKREIVYFFKGRWNHKGENANVVKAGLPVYREDGRINVRALRSSWI